MSQYLCGSVQCIKQYVHDKIDLNDSSYLKLYYW